MAAGPVWTTCRARLRTEEVYRHSPVLRLRAINGAVIGTLWGTARLREMDEGQLVHLHRQAEADDLAAWCS